MAYTLGNKYAKNLCKWIVLLQLIIENVVTCFFLEHSVYTWSDQKHTDILLAWETDWDQTAQTVPTALQLRTTNCTQREYKLLPWLQFLNSPFSGIFRIKKSSCSHVHTLKCSWDIFGYNRMHNITCKQLNLMPFYISIMCNP